MTIRPSTAITNEYNDISAFCKERGEPIFLTKNGEGDLVVMSIETFTQREAMLDLREKLLEAEAQYLGGAKTYTVTQVSERLLGYKQFPKAYETIVKCSKI
ncbi:MAG: type II toxin-antitoxin system Phd/YefM family antitoxin [Clostridiales bacterium]|jgi:PHD/YefM family antitoxin component YafN of YafNO toxin-antitoxin module|nr:type II toxin-antitoxin system Phd/YefM family antitoxin [Clostridiales bacterium]